jgi:hypothetical protein
LQSDRSELVGVDHQQPERIDSLAEQQLEPKPLAADNSKGAAATGTGRRCRRSGFTDCAVPDADGPHPCRASIGPDCGACPRCPAPGPAAWRPPGMGKAPELGVAPIIRIALISWA